MQTSAETIRRAEFMSAPDFWITGWDEVNAFLSGLRAGNVFEAGCSQGGRPLRAVAYGEKEPIERRSQMNSAILGGHLEDFFDPDQRRRPVMLIISTIHGAEVEGCAACLNLVNILEQGADLRGRQWEALRDLAAGMRLVLAPIAQPDGRIRSAVRHLNGATADEATYYSQGQPRDKNIKPSWEWFLRHTPVSPDLVEFLGGYFNDAGVNLDLDEFMSARLAPETAALLDLARAETPDCVMVLHTHGPGPWIAAPNAFVPQRCQYHQAQIRALVAERHRREGLRPAAPPVTGPGELDYFNLPTALYHASGALPLAFEFPHGLQRAPYTFDEILDIGLTMFEEVLRYVDACRYIPGRFTHNARGLREVPAVRRKPSA